MKKLYMLTATWVVLMAFQNIQAQLVINGATLYLESGAVVTVRGNFSSTTDIQGPGKIVMNGTSNQEINMNGYAIPVLEINNAANITLIGNMKLSSNLLFTNGRIMAGVNNFTFSPSATFTGAGAGKYIETNDIGQVRKEVTAAGSYILPIGKSNVYLPLQYDLSGNTFGSGAFVSGLIVPVSHPKKPIRSEDFLTAYWKTSYTNITGGAVDITTTYDDANSYAGSEAFLNGLRYDGTNWSLTNNTMNTTSNTVTFNSVATGTDLYAMNKFVLMNAKVLLQGAFDGTGKMTDALRSLNLIPLSDPYRTAPYTSFFSHTNNAVTEVANANVFAAQANADDNIVDWVFVELRNASGTLMQTRSAFVQKDGDIVDVDGVNPLYFKNLVGAGYVITVRHRNHLGLSADIVNYTKTLSVANPTAANQFDFTSATDNQVFGDASAFYTSGAFKILWAGNASSNNTSRYTGPSNDHSYLLSTALSGNSSAVLSSIYSSGDLNMNGNVRYTGPSNDHSVLLTNVLAGNSSTVITQQIITP